jgi:asparagine synthase (glutamine-hydrolysing)
MVDGDFGFGMRRLSIIDIAGSSQPMWSRDQRYALVFNGKIYNFKKLREELAGLGHSFTTHGDTETILAAYQQWGDDAWNRLDGMFAVAIWDRRERRLILARDPIGIKPLYYHEQDGGIAFASELKALLVLPELDFDVDPRGLHDYFTFGHVRTPRSIYRQVRTLPPGHVLSIGPTGAAQLHAYWQARYHQSETLTEAAWVDRFRATWLEAVEGQMVADVEIGAFLSGGVDSSAVVAAMARVSDRPVKTFTIGFPVSRYDESAHAEETARHLGCDHVTRTIELKDALEVLSTVQRCYDEPFADPSAVPTWYVSRIAAEHVKVALSGDGGDELFFGYKRHLAERKMSRLPGSVRWAAGRFANIPPMPWKHGNRLLQRWQKSARSAALPDGVSRFFAKTQITSPALRAALFDGGLLEDYDRENGVAQLSAEYFPDAKAISGDPLEQFAMCDLALNLPGAMLTKVDRASMAHSLEVRVPMLSQSVIDLAMGMPANMKLRDGIGKHVIRRAIEPWLPPGTMDRRKQGFQMPLSLWFSGDFGARAQELWNDSGAAREGYLNERTVDRLFAEHRAGRKDHSRFLYALSIYCLWSMERSRALAQHGSVKPRKSAQPAAELI